MDKCEHKRTLRSEYDKMKTEREVWLDAAKTAAKYTIPAIMPEDTTLTKSRYKQTLKSPNQSVGADGINNLASKVTMTLLPPNQTFYRFTMDEASLQRASEMSGADRGEFEIEVNKGLAKIEKLVLDHIEHSSDRVCLGEAFKHLYITGNVLLVYEAERGLKYYPLSRYCIKRDYYGNVQQVITEEKVGFLDLPESIQEKILKKHFDELNDKTEDEKAKQLSDKEFTLYTGFKRCKKVWRVCQEVEDFDIEEAAGQYPLDVCPVIPLRYARVDGESCGRGLVEEYFGDISILTRYV